MAIAKLYPPNIAGTIPSFYSTNNGTTELVVPFSMNTSVAISKISGFNLRLKTTASNIVLAEIKSTDYDLDEEQIVFILEQKIVKKLVIGNFYKLQLAYIGIDNAVGYYSTTAVIKYTAEPTISIMGFESSGINYLASQTIVGTYENSDYSELVYQYQFTLYDINMNRIEASGLLLHNTQNDTSDGLSQDSYTIKHDLVEGQTYVVRYDIVTINGIRFFSDGYEVMAPNLNEPSLEISCEEDYDNGIVKIIITTEESEGEYTLYRATAADNYEIWSELQDFNLKDTKELEDFSFSSGISYKYAIAAEDSKKIISNIITPKFEDIFLYDGNRQLRVRFNPKVSSFKNTIQETKKITLGYKFPFVLRNGISNYKEFPISGLISYLMDNDEYFITKTELLNSQDESFKETTDPTDENITLERRFKLAALKWLSNGEEKLFRSPYEGNYIVRLMDVSLSPEDTLGRMLHSFSCTAVEVADTLEVENSTDFVNANDPTTVNFNFTWYDFE